MRYRRKQRRNVMPHVGSKIFHYRKDVFVLLSIYARRVFEIGPVEACNRHLKKG